MPPCLRAYQTKMSTSDELNKDERIRIASFCASGNKREFLTDQTGNRRWLPFEVESNEEQLLPVYFQPANPGDNGAVFMTAAEISAKLVDYGSIKKPLALNKLGTVLRKAGYRQQRYGKRGTRGFVVYLIQDIDNQRKMAAREAVEVNTINNSTDKTDKTDNSF